VRLAPVRAQRDPELRLEEKTTALAALTTTVWYRYCPLVR
jgi:hypothetical protein